MEPDLQPVAPNQLHGSSANKQDSARLDIAANGVWGGRLVFEYESLQSHYTIQPESTPIYCLSKHEREKKRAYEQRVREIEHSSFTPLVLSASGGMGTEATIFYKRLASLLAGKWDTHYSRTVCWLRCRLSFALLRSSIQALRGVDPPGGML